MPAAIPAIGAAVGVAGGVSQNKSAKGAQANAEAQTALTAEQLQFMKEKYLDQIGSGNQYWADVSKETPLTYDQSLVQAGNELNPVYDRQMKETLDNVNSGLMSRGLFGQAPGAALTQEAASKVAQAKAEAVGGRANTLQENSLARHFANKQLGISGFGTYGNTTSIIKDPTVKVQAAKKRSTTDKILDPLGLFG